MKQLTSLAGCAAIMMFAAMAVPTANGAELSVDMRKATQSGSGDSVGTVTISMSESGATFNLKLHGLPPGPHGFHVHENEDCDPILMNGVRIPAGAAGGHWDPGHASKHEGPMGHGHQGDLPLIAVAADGTAAQTVTAPNIKDLDQLKHRSVVIHAGGDNYSDDPNPLGGGGLRIACGSIK